MRRHVRQLSPFSELLGWSHPIPIPKLHSVANNTCPFVSRGGLKLAAALDAFSLDVTGLNCADFGASTGGFTDCLLQHGATCVYSIDTAYGALAWTLRNDRRVIVLERTNVLHANPHTLENFTGCDLITIDLGWTRQRHAIPTALRWLRQNKHAKIITLIKPHYEYVDSHTLHSTKGLLSESEAANILQHLLQDIPNFGVLVMDHIRSPIRGGGQKGGRGNVEYLALLSRA